MDDSISYVSSEVYTQDLFNNHHDTSSIKNEDVKVPARGPTTNPFVTPYSSPPGSRQGSTTAFQPPSQPRYFRSRRVKKGSVERPWLDRKDPKEKWVTIIPLLGILIGLCISGFLVWDGLRSVVNHQYCPVLVEDWSEGFNEKVWMKEAELGGFG